MSTCVTFVTKTAGKRNHMSSLATFAQNKNRLPEIQNANSNCNSISNSTSNSNNSTTTTTTTPPTPPPTTTTSTVVEYDQPVARGLSPSSSMALRASSLLCWRRLSMASLRSCRLASLARARSASSASSIASSPFRPTRCGMFQDVAVAVAEVVEEKQTSENVIWAGTPSLAKSGSVLG